MESPTRSRGFKIPNARHLEKVAGHYLTRYAASEFSLRRVLDNRLRRAAQRIPEFANDAALQTSLRAVIGTIIERYKKSGILNDVAFTEMKTASLRRAGRSARAIKAKLGQKGIETRLIDRALTATIDGLEPEEAELKAALALARRRRLGPYRKKESGPDQGRKDLATLARAGFSFAVAKQVLGPAVADLIDETF